MLYNDKILKKKFMRTLKMTRNITAAIWSYGSNLQYYNLVFENERSIKGIEDIFGLGFTNKNIFDSTPGDGHRSNKKEKNHDR